MDITEMSTEAIVASYIIDKIQNTSLQCSAKRKWNCVDFSIKIESTSTINGMATNMTIRGHKTVLKLISFECHHDESKIDNSIPLVINIVDPNSLSQLDIWINTVLASDRCIRQ